MNGTARPGRMNQHEPQPPPFEGDHDLERRAAEIWDEQTPLLIRLGILTVLDGNAFRMYCTEVARVEELQRLIDEEGFVIEGK